MNRSDIKGNLCQISSSYAFWLLIYGGGKLIYETDLVETWCFFLLLCTRLLPNPFRLYQHDVNFVIYRLNANFLAMFRLYDISLAIYRFDAISLPMYKSVAFLHRCSGLKPFLLLCTDLVDLFRIVVKSFPMFRLDEFFFRCKG